MRPTRRFATDSDFAPGWPVRLVALSLLLCGCPWSKNPNVRGKISNRDVGALLGRASFDFSCPQEEITLTKVAQLQVGAEGCGQRGVYVRTGSGYVLNNVGKEQRAPAD